MGKDQRLAQELQHCQTRNEQEEADRKYAEQCQTNDDAIFRERENDDRRFAQELQNIEDQYRKEQEEANWADRKYAEHLQAFDDRIIQEQESNDHQLAKELQNDQDQARKQQEDEDWNLAHLLKIVAEEACGPTDCDKGDDSAMMATTNVGKAVLAVGRIHQQVQEMAVFGMEPVARDDMVHCAEQFLAKQDDFADKGIPTNVDIGYHYTSEKSMTTIRTHGLLTKADRLSSGIHSSFHGLNFGDGIYTTNNPYASTRYGEVGLIVARLQGNTFRFNDRRLQYQNATTIVGNLQARACCGKWSEESDPYDEIVLRTSSQCLPLVRYSRTEYRKDSQHVHRCAAKMTRLVDELFNKNTDI